LVNGRLGLTKYFKDTTNRLALLLSARTNANCCWRRLARIWRLSNLQLARFESLTSPSAVALVDASGFEQE
jgi:hypothetical protein